MYRRTCNRLPARRKALSGFSRSVPEQGRALDYLARAEDWMTLLPHLGAFVKSSASVMPHHLAFRFVSGLGLQYQRIAGQPNYCTPMEEEEEGGEEGRHLQAAVPCLIPDQCHHPCPASPSGG